MSLIELSMLEPDVGFALTIHADVESRSELDIRDVGAYRYWEHPSTECLMMAYRISEGPLQMWDRGEPQPDGMRQAIADGAVIVAHNAEFEMLAFRWLGRRHGWLVPKKYRCTAAMAAAMSLPRDLESLGTALNLQTQKDKEGKQLIKWFSQPRKDGGFNEPEDFPTVYKRFRLYCARDVQTEEAAEARMAPLSAAEEQVYRLGLRINDRGIPVDIESIRAALVLAERSKAGFNAKMKEATGGAVISCTATAALKTWINAQGVATATLTKADLHNLLELDLPSHVKRAIGLRLAAGKTSVSKLESMLTRASSDGRVRGAFVYHAASTGRFQSFGVNFANLPRPRKIYTDEDPRLDVLFDAIRHRDPQLLEFLYGPDLGSPMLLLADAIRSFIKASDGKKLVVSDYSSIEGVVVAWLAGEAWKLAAYQELIDNPALPDMYRRAAAGIMGMSVEEIGKKHPLRQSVGKISELALGFGGGVGAFASMARGYGIDLDALFDPVYSKADDVDIIASEKRYKEACSRKERTTLALSEDAWLACDLIKRGWRARNAMIKQSWWDLEAAVREAVRHPGKETEAARVKYLTMHGFLFAKLPSGRCLAYPAPKLRAQVYASRLIDGTWAAPEVLESELADKLEAMGKARIMKESFPKATALGIDSQTKQFVRFGLYGGLIAENNTQATARDILVNGMFKAEHAGYPIVATVYDEIVAECDRGFGSPEELSRLMCQLPPWAHGLPLSAAGYQGERYKKG